MRPVLDAVADGHAKHVRDVRRDVATALQLSDADLALTIPSGSRLFDSRVHWAVTYFAQALVVRRPRRGFVKLTDRGRDLLARQRRLTRVRISRC
jgi:restriction system protein